MSRIIAAPRRVSDAEGDALPASECRQETSPAPAHRRVSFLLKFSEADELARRILIGAQPVEWFTAQQFVALCQGLEPQIQVVDQGHTQIGRKQIWEPLGWTPTSFETLHPFSIDRKRKPLLRRLTVCYAAIRGLLCSLAEQSDELGNCNLRVTDKAPEGAGTQFVM